MSKKFEFADLVGKQITGVSAEFGGGHGGTDDYLGLDINDGSQVQITGELGAMKMLNGELEDVLDREIVSAVHANVGMDVDYDYVDVDTFVLTVVAKSYESAAALTPVISGYHTVVVQYVHDNPGQLTVERKE